MRLFLTSDQHLCHQRIRELANRPFSSVEEMNEELIERWNSVVNPSDHVIVLGDFALGKIAESLLITKLLNGHKALVPGNHDRMFPDPKVKQEKIDEWTTKYLDAGFDNIRPPGLLGVGPGRVQINHFPYAGDSHDDDRYVEHRPIDKGGWLLHGHVHGKWRQRGKMVNVGVDTWNGYPVPAGTLHAMINDGPRDLDPLPWS